MANPNQTATRVPRRHAIQIRVTDADYRRIRKASTKLQKSVGGYCAEASLATVSAWEADR